MHPYIPHLIEDIKAAERPDGPVEISSSQAFEEEMEAIERWASGEDELNYTFSYYCGLTPEQFPPVDQLTDIDLQQVCKAYKHLLFTWNSGIDLPDALPLPLRYQFMINMLDEGFSLVNSGCMTFDYCTGYAPDCAFGKYCPCRDIWYKDDKE